MTRKDIHFTLDKHSYIRISVPSYELKENYYYPPQDDLDQFDEAIAEYIYKQGCILLQQDILQEVMLPFYGALQNALRDPYPLPENCTPGWVGYDVNRAYHNMSAQGINTQNITVWSYPRSTKTMIYRYDDIVYLEIAPIYPWHFHTPFLCEPHVTYETCMLYYAPYVFIAIEKSIAIQWRYKLYDFLQSLGILYMTACDTDR